MSPQFNPTPSLHQPTVTYGNLLTGLGVYNVKSAPFYAQGNGSTDDTASINAAIAAVALAGSGIVYFPPGNYLISSSLNITSSNITLIGAGANATVISAAAHAAFTGINIAGTSPSARITNVTVQSLAILQNAAPSTINPAIKISYTVLPKLLDVFISQWGTGVYLLGAIDHYSDRVYISTIGATAANVYGYYVDGTTQNSSCYLSHAIAAHASYGGAGHSYSYYVGGADISDFYMLQCEADESDYGLYFNPSGGTTNILDIQIIGCVFDECLISGIYIQNLVVNAGMIHISGGWCAPGASSTNSVYVNTGSGFSIEGMQLYAVTARTNCTAIFVVNSQSFTMHGCIIKNFLYGVQNAGSPSGTIAGNTIYNPYALGGSAIVNTSPRIAIYGNNIDGVSGAWAYGINLGTGALNCVVSLNEINPASCSTAPITSVSTNTGTLIKNNPLYNPIGSVTVTPVSHAWTNTTGTDVTVYVLTAGSYTGTTTLTPNGLAAVTLPNAVVGMSYLVPPSATLTWGVGGTVSSDPTYAGIGN